MQFQEQAVIKFSYSRVIIYGTTNAQNVQPKKTLGDVLVAAFCSRIAVSSSNFKKAPRFITRFEVAMLTKCFPMTCRFTGVFSRLAGGGVCPNGPVSEGVSHLHRFHPSALEQLPRAWRAVRLAKNHPKKAQILCQGLTAGAFIFSAAQQGLPLATCCSLSCFTKATALRASDLH